MSDETEEKKRAPRVRPFGAVEAHVTSVTWKRMKGPAGAGDESDVRDLFAQLNTKVYLKTKTMPKWLDDMLPGIDDMAQAIAASEGHPGVVLKTRLKLQDVTLRLTPVDANMGDVLTARRAKVTGQPTLTLDGSGEGTLSFSFVTRVKGDDRAKIISFCDGADVFISTDAQIDAFDDTSVKTTKKRGSTVNTEAQPAA